MACDATSLIATAMGNGYAGMSDRDLKMAVLASACAGGGGGGIGSVVCQAGPPVAAPPSGCGLSIDTTNGDLWKYYSGGWH